MTFLEEDFIFETITNLRAPAVLILSLCQLPGFFSP